MFPALLIAGAMNASAVGGCPQWTAPVDGEVIARFAPGGGYSGHWGVDFEAEPGELVVAPVAGEITFSGVVAGNRSITIRSSDGLRFSVSYLSAAFVDTGQRVVSGATIGEAGWAHGRPSVHMSVRLGSRYLDPVALCRPTPPMVRLLPPVSRVTWRRGYPVRRMKRAIVGGTFDPPHLAHLLAGEAAFRQLGVEVVTFIPAGAPWQKADRDVTAADHRWNMTVLATEGIPYFEADDREVIRDGWTYTIETLESYEPDDVVLVLGADTAINLPTWQRAAEVMARARIAVVPRPGSDRTKVDEVLEGRHIWLDMPEVAISGTEIRERLRSGRSVRFLVREAVWEYIERERIYHPEV